MPSQQSRTRTWSVATSPRSPRKLPDELGLLAASFEGRIWDKESQRSYALQLAQDDFFEGEVSSREPDFSARDRVNRAPKTFGFIRLDGRRPPIEILPAGRQLIEHQNLPDLFLHQLLKWQYPSPVMAQRYRKDYTELFYIKPFLECLRLVRELNGISKLELAIFAVPLVDYRDYDDVRGAIRNFREQLGTVSGRGPRGKFIRQVFDARLGIVYRDDIRDGRIATREEAGQIQPVEEFLKKKARNLRDYADAAMRYFQATGLFTIASSTFQYYLRLFEERIGEVDHILENVIREPEPYHDVEKFYSYLGNPDFPTLPGDDPGVLRSRITELYSSSPPSIRDQVRPTFDASRTADSPADLKTAYALLSKSVTDMMTKQRQEELEGNMDALQDIETVFDQIIQSEVPDRPLYLEWNVWRALSFLNYGAVQANFRMDQEGNPVSLATGNKSDIECHYEKFHVIVDVTMSYGARQYDTESIPVPRHVGSFQKERRAGGDDRPVYGLFVAHRIHPEVTIPFWYLHKIPLRSYGGVVSVIPLDLEDLRALLRKARQVGHWSADDIHHFFERARANALSTSDEKEWHRQLRKLARNWLA